MEPLLSIGLSSPDTHEIIPFSQQPSEANATITSTYRLGSRDSGRLKILPVAAPQPGSDAGLATQSTLAHDRNSST